MAFQSTQHFVRLSLFRSRKLSRLGSSNVMDCQKVIRFMSTELSSQFEMAKAKLNTLKNEPGNDVKLKIYALFKQATLGENTTKKPGAFNFVGQAKWSAWHELKKMSMDDAKQEYVNVIEKLAAAEGLEETPTQEPSTETQQKYENLFVTKENAVTRIVLNRPHKKNALTREMYEEIIAALNEAANDNSAVTIITGAGDFFCSGNDLGNFMSISPDKMQEIAVESGDLLRRYVSAYIDFPKPLVAAVNGPAIGVAVTVLGLFDVVFAAEHATFSTPFSNLGQSPEGCSTYTFPKIMGHSKACEMMLFNRKLNAKEAHDCGLVTRVLHSDTFEANVLATVNEMASLPVKSLVYSKALMRGPELEILHKVNVDECNRLVERWTSEDCINAVMKFFSAKAN
ncbi:enoyl-CoA delta isomerase 2-like isoform X2 [Clavelina lepadiformis]|uniref:enoyl-CoA delta isomerase 2-like isoform X2 n=1 Tax=Clavelina lepadiformis TaxID=159417 RepID=UPI0040424D06